MYCIVDKHSSLVYETLVYVMDRQHVTLSFKTAKKFRNKKKCEKYIKEVFHGASYLEIEERN